MSGIQSVPPPVQGPSARTDLPAALATGTRSPPAARLETARAVLPVDGAPRAVDVQFTDRQGRPVGPPPAFQVSLLEARREVAMQPITSRAPGMAEVDGGFAPPAADSVPEQVDRKV